MSYPTPHHERRQSIIEQAEEAHEAAVARVDRLMCDLGEIDMARAEKLREIRKAEEVATETEVRLSMERIIGNPRNVLAVPAGADASSIYKGGRS